MTTWIVAKEQIDKQFTLQELLTFSKNTSAKVIIPEVMTLKDGRVTWLA